MPQIGAKNTKLTKTAEKDERGAMSTYFFGYERNREPARALRFKCGAARIAFKRNTAHKKFYINYTK